MSLKVFNFVFFLLNEKSLVFTTGTFKWCISSNNTCGGTISQVDPMPTCFTLGQADNCNFINVS